MAKIHDHLIPLSVLHSRLEAHRDELRAELARTPWWQWRRINILAGSIGAYNYELNELLRISSEWQPFWDDLGRTPDSPDLNSRR